ncbi:MAG: glycoside hydrolase family 1 protein [Candidatus Omnitrophota bacterium]
MKDRFPDNFLWGASTSSHQVEGDNFFNDWWEWEQAGHTEPSGKACDHYHRFKEDFSLAKELAHNTHRLGLEWSRLEKEDGIWDQNEWDHYKTVLDELIKLGIKPIVTLHHFTLPIWLSRKGGWINDNAASYFSRFAVKAIEELGSRVEYWITINEPNILAVLGYYRGIWPPCKKDFGQMLLVIKNMLKAHSNSYGKMHECALVASSTQAPKIGIAKAVTAFHPASKTSLVDRFYAHLRSRFHNHAFIRSLIKGRICIPGLRPEKLPFKDTVDFIGLNYYFRQFIYGKKPVNKFPFGEVYPPELHKDSGEITDMGWEVYPEGLYEIVKSFIKYNKPIMITENGLATTDDTMRRRYIKNHLKQLLRVINEGAPVTGYIHWSLMDNFEWADGYGKRFGLIGVDYATLERSTRESARYLAEIIKTGKIPD